MKALFRCISFLFCLVILLGALSWLFLPKNNTYEDGIGDFLAGVGITARAGIALDGGNFALLHRDLDGAA